MKQEQQIQILKKIRCPSCQGQTIDTSNALIAQDMRNLVQEGMRVGKPERGIINEIKYAYGSDVLVDSQEDHFYLFLLFTSVVCALAIPGMIIWKIYKKKK
jgi:cytochrome c-type biogenesis protein CcmH/NrfF